MTEQKRLSLSLACGLSLTIALTVATFTVESQQVKCVLSWPGCLLFRWLLHPKDGEYMCVPIDAVIGLFCYLVGFFIAATIYSFLTLVVLDLITKDEKVGTTQFIK